MVEERDNRGKMVKRYPMAAKMGKSVFECKHVFEGTQISKTVEKAYKLVASLQGARDLCEEYIATHVWPLCKGWNACCSHVKRIGNKSYKFPDFDSARPRWYKSDMEFVEALEAKACEILGTFIKKKRDLLVIEILGENYKCSNRIFETRKIAYGERPPPTSRGAKPNIKNVTCKKRASTV